MSDATTPGGTSPARRALTPVARGNLADRVLDQLRAQIADGAWPVDARLPVEAALAKELGVGRSTVREAVRVLVHAGVLEVRQGDGTYVRSRYEIDAALARDLSTASLLDAYEARRALDVEAAGLAALRRSVDDIARLRVLLAQRVDAYALGSMPYLRAHRAVYERIFAASGNELLCNLLRTFHEPIHTGVATNLDDVNLVLEGPEDRSLAAIVDAIADADPEAAADAARRRIDGLIRIVRFALQAVAVPRTPNQR